ncbi:hypothetical protein GCM10007854_25650 [Algimonas porphyrae]|uniref:Uncharacterized protein n=1 Tax=Algimonas porphyrae TaxID=1128113 RepID=A0ABQ5V3E7_9PROT|nr:hypothetical protein GCM10007854_25650 [Algimonas porphyrae]
MSHMNMGVDQAGDQQAVIAVNNLRGRFSVRYGTNGHDDAIFDEDRLVWHDLTCLTVEEADIAYDEVRAVGL